MASLLARLDVRRLVLSLVVALALVGLWFGVTQAETGETGLGPKDPAIEAISPRPDELVLRQTEIVVDLAPGYRGELYIDGQQIAVVDTDSEGRAPTSAFDAVFDPAQNIVAFRPKEGASIEELTPGTHRVTVVYWRLAESPDNGRNYSWSFRVQG